MNVGGTIFETFPSTLAKYPNTLLGALVHPRNTDLRHFDNDQIFFDRDPRTFEVILNFYRTGKLMPTKWTPMELLREELRFFSIDTSNGEFFAGAQSFSDRCRISMEMVNLNYKSSILDASVYRKISRQKLISEHHVTLGKILDYFFKKIEKSSNQGHNSCEVNFFSPLHYTENTERSVFNVISKNEIRELIVDMLKDRNFTVEESSEYSKTKATNIIGLHDQVTHYHDPKFFSFTVKW
uniref:Potassium channel tetramerisation-type BTB domain-containing protein n=1 Tax=Arcella intermedia TaxID=1963864 RepID=A0A6B2LFB6_9EUKA